MGRRADITVHFMLWLSFFIVSRVVEQGQCKQEKIIVQSAVNCVQPFDKRIVFTACVEKVSLNTFPPL